jgi:hypothetical protein
MLLHECAEPAILHKSLGALENSQGEFSWGESRGAREGPAGPFETELVAELREAAPRGARSAIL